MARLNGLRNYEQYRIPSKIDLFNPTNSIKDIEAQLTGTLQRDCCHLRVQQRTSRKKMTIVENLPPDLDLKKILRYMRKQFSCNGNIQKDKQDNLVLRMSGDQRQNVKDFLVQNHILTESEIHVHGA
jgi:translation initiation factor 1